MLTVYLDERSNRLKTGHFQKFNDLKMRYLNKVVTIFKSHVIGKYIKHNMEVCFKTICTYSFNINLYFSICQVYVIYKYFTSYS